MTPPSGGFGARAALALLLLALLGTSGCGWWRSGAQVDPVAEIGVVEFAERIERFYRTLERVPLDTLMTYDDARLRSFFSGPQEFTDYYASLASQVRRSQLKHATAQRVEIRSFRFPSPDRAEVDLTLVGPNTRALLFWDVELDRTDTWRLVGDTWVVDPGKI